MTKKKITTKSILTTMIDELNEGLIESIDLQIDEYTRSYPIGINEGAVITYDDDGNIEAIGGRFGKSNFRLIPFSSIKKITAVQYLPRSRKPWTMK